MAMTELEAALIEQAIGDIQSELAFAFDRFPSMGSPHEGYAVCLEELDELWEIVKGNEGKSGDARAEARQLAAMAIRYMVDVAR